MNVSWSDLNEIYYWPTLNKCVRQPSDLKYLEWWYHLLTGPLPFTFNNYLLKIFPSLNRCFVHSCDKWHKWDKNNLNDFSCSERRNTKTLEPWKWRKVEYSLHPSQWPPPRSYSIEGGLWISPGTGPGTMGPGLWLQSALPVCVILVWVLI